MGQRKGYETMKDSATCIRLGSNNCYLLKAREGYLLIDCGYQWDRNLLMRRLERLNVRPGQISHLLLTNHHDNHSGLINFLLEKNPGIRLIMHRECAAQIRKGENDRTGGGGYTNWVIRFISLVYQMLHPEWNLRFPTYSPRPSDIIVTEEGDDTLRNIGVPGIILFTPGHSTDSISVLTDEGDVFAGDAAMNWLKWAGSYYVSVSVNDLDDYYRSWEKILSHRPRMIHPSHGSPFPPDRLMKYIGRVKSGDLIQYY
ncbi:MAG: MBL fold metallo-hydrolase [Spirochaetes bacterium]|nr:MBL fold metallo-hydrolase [Spirochaetota bacterium]